LASSRSKSWRRSPTTRNRAIERRRSALARMTTPAIVMRKLDFRETSLLVWLFTREAGRFTVLAKGAYRPRSPFLGALDLFIHLEADLVLKPGREIQVLAGARVENAHRGLSRHPLRLAGASCLVEEALRALPEGRKDPGLFDLLAAGLILMEKFPLERIQLARRAWETRFLDLLGLGFSLERCAACGRPLPPGVEEFFFSSQAGGCLCPEHAGGNRPRKVHRGVLALFRAFRTARAPQLAALPVAREDFRTASELLDQALEDRLEARLLSAPVLGSLSLR